MSFAIKSSWSKHFTRVDAKDGPLQIFALSFRCRAAASRRRHLSSREYGAGCSHNLRNKLELVFVTKGPITGDIQDKIRVIAENIDGTRVEITTLPVKEDDLLKLRFLETKRKASLQGSPFCDKSFRRGLVQMLQSVESKIKKLAVN